jgi:hypothetical protein
MARRLEPSTPKRQRRDRESARATPPIGERSRRGVATRPEVDPAVADDDVVRPDEVSIDEVVERLSRDISDAVNRVPFDESHELRSYASDLVREDAAPRAVHAAPPVRRARLSFFVIAVWLAIAGAALAFVLPPAGIVCFVMAAVAAVLAAIVGPGDAVGSRATTSSSPPDTPSAA